MKRVYNYVGMLEILSQVAIDIVLLQLIGVPGDTIIRLPI